MQRRALLALGGVAFAANALPLMSRSIAAQPPPEGAHVINPKEAPFGAAGNFATDDTAAIQAAVDACFGSASQPNGTAKVTSNRILYFPPGHYRVMSPIQLTKLHGGRILGSGRFVTKITNVAGGSVFATNGCGFSHFEGMYLQSSGKTAPVFDLNWDGTPGGPALQSNTFFDILFDGGATGIDIGAKGYMGSENIFINCLWIYSAEAGLKTSNFNACQNTIIGGDFQACNMGAWVQRGSICAILSVGFQLSRQWDIRVDNSADDTLNIIGCRTESSNFVKVYNFVHASIQGCTQSEAGAGGYFLQPDGCPVTVERCVSVTGQIGLASNARLTVRGSSFGRTDWLQHFPLNYGQSIELEDVQYGGTPNRGSPQSIRRIARQRITSSGVHHYVTAPE
jgi:Pectate lyase superfamily protein